jgi:predicted ATPase
LAHITKFSVSELCGRKGVYEQKLDRHINIFFGLNGSGKTSLLRLLDAAMDNETEGLENLPFTSADVYIYSERYKREFKRSVYRDKLPVSKKKESVVGDALYMTSSGVARRKEGIPWITEPNEKDLVGAWQHVFLPISRMYTPGRNVASHPWAFREFSDIEQVLNESFAENVKTVWTNYWHKLQAEVRRAQSQGLANILKGVLAPSDKKDVNQKLDPDVAYSNLRSFLKRQGSPHVLPKESVFKSRFAEDPELRSVVSDIDEVEHRIAAAMAPRAKLEELLGRMFSGHKSVVFGEAEIEVRVGKEGKISTGQLSSGEKQVLKILVESLRVEESSLLIDEPELSMHVDWQRELISSIRSLNPECQLILATHSPEIMADIDDSRIFRL